MCSWAQVANTIAMSPPDRKQSTVRIAINTITWHKNKSCPNTLLDSTVCVFLWATSFCAGAWNTSLFICLQVLLNIAVSLEKKSALQTGFSPFVFIPPPSCLHLPSQNSSSNSEVQGDHHGKNSEDMKAITTESCKYKQAWFWSSSEFIRVEIHQIYCNCYQMTLENAVS